MRVKHLVVVALPKSDSDGETKKAAADLYKKYATRSPGPLTCSHYLVETRKAVTRGEAKQAKGYEKYVLGDGHAPTITKVDGAAIDASWFNGNDVDVGVYLVFHCDSNGYPTIFDATHSQSYAYNMQKGGAAMALGMILLDLGLTRIRKVALVACTTHKTLDDAQHITFLEMFCGALKGLYDEPPMIAGWDDYLEVTGDGSKATGTPATPATPDLRKQHKFVAKFRNGKYEIGGVEQSGWSDKQQLPTTLGPSSTFG